jgi:hypothetical protein
MSITSTLIKHPAKQTKTLMSIIKEFDSPKHRTMHHYHYHDDVFHVMCTIFLCHGSNVIPIDDDISSINPYIRIYYYFTLLSFINMKKPALIFKSRHLLFNLSLFFFHR